MLLEALGISTFLAKETGLPLSSDSAKAKSSTLDSIKTAIF